MRSKYIVFIALAVAAAVVQVEADWRKHQSGTLAWLYAVEFIDEKTGFAAGSNGTLLATSDAGENWEKRPLPVLDTVRDVRFSDRLNGWLLCDRGRRASGPAPSYLLRTFDGGRTWTVQELKASRERFAKLFLSPLGDVFLVGESGEMLNMPAGGLSPETRQSLPVKYLLTDGWFLKKQTIVLVGGGGTVLLSDDGGANWNTPAFSGDRPEKKLNSVFFTDHGFGLAAGNGGSIVTSDDGGRSWRRRESGTDADLFDAALFDQKTGFAVGDRGTILRTVDSGATWVRDVSGSKHRLERLSFAGRRAVAVGFGGTIISAELR